MSTGITSISIGKRLAQYRESISKSQQELAVLIGSSRSYIGDIETERCLPSRRFMKKLLDGTDVSSDWLLTGEGPMRREKEVTDLNRTLSDSVEGSVSDNAKKITNENNQLHKSDTIEHTRGKYPITETQIEGMVVSEFEKLPFEQQLQVLEFIIEKRRLNDLEKQVSALTAQRW